MEATFKLGNHEVHGLPAKHAEALVHTARGLNSKETAKAMNISYRTVEHYLNYEMARFGASNRVHLFLQAVTVGAFVIKDAAAVIKDTAVCLVLSFLLLFASMPGTSVQSTDDLQRVPARNLRLRRRNEDSIALTTHEDIDA